MANTAKPLTAAQWVAAQYDPDQLRDIAEHGCAACAPNGLTYYSETVDFYKNHEGEILDELEQTARDYMGSDATVWCAYGAGAGDLEQLQNALVWAFAELVAQRCSA